ncbi:MAG TPA: helix-turn-helix transcriptional regulator [Pyrinomonadaceae bacterium]|jgi:transcriptional regulator with XRE-family HTH domain
MFVNNYLQESSQKTQIVFHNYTMSVIQDTETLAGFVSKAMKEKDLTARDVEEKSGGNISHSYVNKIKNGDAKNPSPASLKALAKGLDEPEEIIFAIVRGVMPDEDEIERIEIEAMYKKRKNLSPAKKEAFRRLLDMVDRELDRMMDEETAANSQN